MSDTPQTTQATQKSQAPAQEGAGSSDAHGHDDAAAAGPKIHRVCISCNNMFVVPVDNYEAKHCSVCHKG
jgi:hypothetical protein